MSDNYAYVIRSGDRAIVVDPGEESPIRNVIEKQNLQLSHILITHYDHDHIGGVEALRKKYGAKVVGPGPSIIKLDEVAAAGGTISAGSLDFSVFDTPGHAYPHVCFYEKNKEWLFSGDCLFGAGCGRVGERSYRDMWKSIQTLARLPDDTQVFFGHEYTIDNLAFAASVEPENPDIELRRKEVLSGLKKGRFSSPSTLAIERKTNPFLRTQSEEIRAGLSLLHASDEDVFTSLRRAKNSFR